jgi:hypothetical protein
MVRETAPQPYFAIDADRRCCAVRGSRTKIAVRSQPRQIISFAGIAPAPFYIIDARNWSFI